MRFLTLYHPNAKTAATPPTAKHFEEMGKFVEAMFRSGELLATGGLGPGAVPLRVRLEDGKYSVVDGPFAEAKELIGGFALCELPSRERAIETCKEFLAIAGDGESEIFQLMDGPPPT